MFSRVSCRIMEEGHQSSSERKAESPKRGLRETYLTDPVINPAEPPKKIGCFELSDDSYNIWGINSDYANKHIKTFLSNQTLIEGILSANPIPSGIKGIFS